MSTKIELKIGETAFTIPVTPESFEISGGYDNQTVNINGLGEILLKGKRNLRTVSWSSFFPREHYDFCQTSEAEHIDPTNYITVMMFAAEFGLTVQVSISDVITLPMTLSTFTYGQDDGTADVNYSVTFTEVREVATPDAAKQTAKRPTKKVVSHMYKWKKGDTWKKVAKKETGKSDNWKKLKSTNKSRVDKAIKAYKKKHPSVKKVKDTTALIGTKILIK
jgi:hypothetical protein